MYVFITGSLVTGVIKIRTPPYLKTPHEKFGKILAKINQPEKIDPNSGKNKNSPGKLRARGFFGV